MSSSGRGAGRSHSRSQSSRSWAPRRALLALGLVLASCVQSSTPPAASPRVVSTNQLAREAGAVFLKVAVYDYALAGHFAGERVRVVAPDRYAAALAADARRLVELKEEATAAAFADARLAPPLVALADACADVADALLRFAATKDADAFAAVAGALDGAWSTVRAVASVLPERDAELERAIARGTAWRVMATRSKAHVVIAAPNGARMGAYADRGAAAQRVAELREQGIVAAVAEEDAYAFARSGPDPASELWREGALDVPTADRARRAAFIAGGLAVAHEDGVVRAYDDAGRPRWSAKLPTAVSLVVPNVTGRWILAGGVQVVVLTHEGRIVGSPARLPSAANVAAWSEPLNAVVAGSPGPTGRPEGGGGTVVAISIEGKALEEPFPLVTPAAGALLAAAAGKDEVYVATTTRGDTDVEVVRPGVEASTRIVLRVEGQHRRLAISADGARLALVTTNGTYRFSPRAANAAATLQHVGDEAREVRFARDGTLYALWKERLVAYDDALRVLWSAPLTDGRRIVAGRRVVVQDGLARLLAVDPKSGAAEELASLGEVLDLAVSGEGAKVLALFGSRALVFALP